MEDDPLIVPANELLHVRKTLIGVFIRELVVKAEHHRLQLRDDDVFVVPRIPDECPGSSIHAAGF